MARAAASSGNRAAVLRTRGRVGAEMLATECLAVDPFTARARMASQGLRADLAALGAVLGIAVAPALTFSFDGALADYGHFQVFGFTALLAAVVLGSLLLPPARVLDRAAGPRRPRVVAEHATGEHPPPSPDHPRQVPARSE